MIVFTKMHGLGNDFVVIDRRGGAIELAPGRIRALADRRRGIGFDQLILIDPPANGAAGVAMRFHNADGGEVGACGNGTRCAAALVMAETGGGALEIETVAGSLRAETRPDGLVAVDMGRARLRWSDIPLASKVDTMALPITLGPLSNPSAVSMGNPHCIFFAPDAEDIDLETLGPQLEHHEMFPERTNVEVATVTGDDVIRLRVWERGAGVTLACGTGACATAVAAHRLGLTGPTVAMDMDGGRLSVEWRENGRVIMIGPVATSFTGEIAP